MQQQRSILDELKHQYNNGGIFMKLIFINVIVFLVINILDVTGRLLQGDALIVIDSIIDSVFTVKTHPLAFIKEPWGLITNMFSHKGFLHLAFNMLLLYSFGRMFLQFFSQKRLLYTYLLGGIFGVLFEMGANIFPAISSTSALGASGAVMAIIFAVSAHRPNLEAHLFGVLKVKLIYIAGALFLINFLKLGVDDGVARFAHIGGAALGLISVQNLQSSNNIITMAQRFGDWFRSLFRKKPKLTVNKGNARQMTDEEYNADKKRRQEQTDRILDKISKSGYESLTKKEKDFLFKQSK
ncbi:MAG: rhomboid family intramembrane serine protease [Bacteroidetes bacterium]|nr:MAG: rhomboid family intramembrane serine protease [Bacteroidota bacterium]